MTEFYDGWESWSKYVIKSIEKLEAKVDSIELQMHTDKLAIQEDIITLKTKATIWGSISGTIVSVIMSIIVGLTVYHINHSKDINKIKNPKTTVENTTKKVNYELGTTIVKKW